MKLLDYIYYRVRRVDTYQVDGLSGKGIGYLLMLISISSASIVLTLGAFVYGAQWLPAHAKSVAQLIFPLGAILYFLFVRRYENRGAELSKRWDNQPNNEWLVGTIICFSAPFIAAGPLLIYSAYMN